MRENCEDPITDTCQIPLPQSIRRGLVFGTGFSLLLISIVSAKNMWDYLIIIAEHASIYDVALLIFSGWGISYVVYLWFSFVLVGFKNLRGCGWTAIDVGLFKRNYHICVDSVLNARQDMEQEKYGISVKLLKNEGSRVWGLGVIGLLVFTYFLTIDFIPPFVKLIFIGIFSSLYVFEDLTIHRFSIARKDLCGQGDFRRLMIMYYRPGRRQRTY